MYGSGWKKTAVRGEAVERGEEEEGRRGRRRKGGEGEGGGRGRREKQREERKDKGGGRRGSQRRRRRGGGIKVMLHKVLLLVVEWNGPLNHGHLTPPHKHVSVSSMFWFTEYQRGSTFQSSCELLESGERVRLLCIHLRR